MKMTVELKRSSSPHVLLSSPVHMAALPSPELFFGCQERESKRRCGEGAEPEIEGGDFQQTLFVVHQGFSSRGFGMRRATTTSF